MKDWKGPLTTTNIEEVSKWLLELLQGNKFTVVISIYEQKKPMVITVSTSRVLSSRPVPPVEISYGCEHASANLTVFYEENQYCFWSTTEYGSEEEFVNPYIEFSCGKQVVVTQWLSTGELYCWIFALEH